MRRKSQQSGHGKVGDAFVQHVRLVVTITPLPRPSGRQHDADASRK
jgi:hypothetical protein